MAFREESVLFSGSSSRWPLSQERKDVGASLPEAKVLSRDVVQWTVEGARVQRGRRGTFEGAFAEDAATDASLLVAPAGQGGGHRQGEGEEKAEEEEAGEERTSDLRGGFGANQSKSSQVEMDHSQCWVDNGSPARGPTSRWALIVRCEKEFRVRMNEFHE